MLPGWQKRLEPHVASGALVVVGVVQEQHKDRIALYRQWRRLDWPIFVDALNLLDHKAVPIPMALSPSGVVVYPRLRGPRDLEVFLSKDFAPVELPRPPLPHPLEGDGLFLAGKLDEAIESYRAAAARSPRARFRLGVALRRRCESAGRRPGDAQAAIDAWTDALAARPDQYIWRRRIQQYGPRLDKPYNMFGWVEQARREIRARGEEPVPLAVEPRGSERMDPRAPVATAQLVDPDPEGKIPADAQGLVEIESMVTPARVRPGQRVRVRLVFRVKEAFWNNEADPLTLHVEPPATLTVAEGLFSYPNPGVPETKEARILEYELAVDESAGRGELTVPGYALYSVCEDKGGTCFYLRLDFTVKVVVDPEAVKIQ